MAAQQTSHSTDLRKDAVGVPGIVFFVLSCQAPLTGVVGVGAVSMALGIGAGTPAAYVIVGALFALFAVGFTTIARHVDSKGGFLAVISAGLGERTGFGGSWLAMFAYQGIQTAMFALLGVSASASVQNHFGVSIPWWVWSLIACGIVLLLGTLNIETGTRVLMVLVLCEFALLVAFAVAVAVHGGATGLDFSASFSPSAVFTGAPGIGIMFAIAAMFGFESTAIYTEEAKDPRRTVPRATYFAVGIITVFFAFVMWMLVSYYGAAEVLPAAGKALGGDPSSFVVVPLTHELGAWAGDAAEVLLITSLLAGVLAFHNMVNRYLHSVSRSHGLPQALFRTNRHRAPYRAAIVNIAVVVLVLLPFVALGKDPMTTIFSWSSGIAVVALVVLYCLASAAIAVYFRRHPVDATIWHTAIAPILSLITMIAALATVLSNFTTLVPGSKLLVTVLMVLVPVVFGCGWFGSWALSRRTAVTEVTVLDADPDEGGHAWSVSSAGDNN